MVHLVPKTGAARSATVKDISDVGNRATEEAMLCCWLLLLAGHRGARVVICHLFLHPRNVMFRHKQHGKLRTSHAQHHHHEAAETSSPPLTKQHRVVLVVRVHPCVVGVGAAAMSVHALQHACWSVL